MPLPSSDHACSECGSLDLTWDFVNTAPRGFLAGAVYATGDVVPKVFLGCGVCSHTEFTIELPEFLAELTRSRQSRP